MLNWIAGKRISAAADFPTDACLVGVQSLVANRVYDSADNLVGRVEEIVIDTRTGCVRHAVLSIGGILGFGGRRLAVPWTALKPDAKYCRCVIDMTLMHLMGVPVSDDDPWLQRDHSTRADANHSRPTRMAGTMSSPRTYFDPMQGT